MEWGYLVIGLAVAVLSMIALGALKGRFIACQPKKVRPADLPWVICLAIPSFCGAVVLGFFEVWVRFWKYILLNGGYALTAIGCSVAHSMSKASKDAS